MTAEWLDWALCVGADPGIFYPDVGESYQPARAICSACPAKTECLAYALATELSVSRYGMWGGATPEERSALARGRSISARPPLMSPEAERALMAAYQRGWSDRQIADFVGRDQSSVRNWRRRRALGPNYSADGSRQRVAAS